MISYNDYQLTEEQVNIIKKSHARQKIAKYIQEHGTEPDDLEPFYNVTEEQLENFKRKIYAKIAIDEFEYEQKYGPSEMIETRFTFTSIDENTPAKTLDKTETILGSGSVSNNEGYQYEYWTIIIPFTGEYVYGTFTSLKNVTISLNSIKKYTIYVYHRKSNYQYSAIRMTKGVSRNDKYEQIYAPIDNQFHSSPLFVEDGMDISTYSPYVNGETIEYQTQSEDKEYVGIVTDYTPKTGGVISGNVYTLNPRMEVTISGLTENEVCKIKEPYLYGKSVVFTRGQNGDFYANGSNSKITKLSNDSFTYLITKDELVNTLTLNKINEWKNQISDPNTVALTWFGCDIYDKDEHLLETIYSNDGAAIDLYRNNQTNGGIIVIPAHGENIDTGFDFEPVDD